MRTTTVGGASPNPRGPTVGGWGHHAIPGEPLPAHLVHAVEDLIEDAVAKIVWAVRSIVEQHHEATKGHGK